MVYDVRIAETRERLARYIAAETHITTGGQAYSIGNRSLTRADLRFIAEMITKLYSEIRTLERGSQIAMQRVVPRDF
jgi:hypothetical protein